MRRHIGARRRRLARIMHLRLTLHAGDMRIELVLRLAVDHRTDMGRDVARIGDLQLARIAGDHLDHAVGHVLLHAEQAQRRAALAGGAEGGHHHVVGHLLGQSGRIDDHGVDAAGLGDQRHDGGVLVGKRAVDDARDLRRAGEDHAGHVLVLDEARADAPVAGHEVKRGLRHAGLVQDAHGEIGDQRRLLGRLGDDRIAGHRAPRSPGRGRWRAGSSRARSPRTRRVRAGAARCSRRSAPACASPAPKRRAALSGVVAQEIDRLAHLRERIVEGLAGLRPAAGEAARRAAPPADRPRAAAPWRGSSASVRLQLGEAGLWPPPWRGRPTSGEASVT